MKSDVGDWAPGDVVKTVEGVFELKLIAAQEKSLRGVAIAVYPALCLVEVAFSRATWVAVGETRIA